MKILFVTNACAAGGAEEHLLDLSGRLCDSGADIVVPVKEEGVFKENVRRSGFPCRTASRFDISISAHRNQDFGIARIESPAFVCPVVAYNGGGYTDGNRPSRTLPERCGEPARSGRKRALLPGIWTSRN